MELSETILNECLRLANLKGWEKVGVREISRALDISPGNLSYHFPKKEALLKELLERMYRDRDDWLEDLLLQGAELPSVLGFIQRLMVQDWEFRGLSEARYRIYFHKDQAAPQDPLQDIHDERLRSLFISLSEHGAISLREEDLYFLVSYTRLFLLGWMSERYGPIAENIRRGIYQFLQQLYYFATSAGSTQINEFLERMEY